MLLPAASLSLSLTLSSPLILLKFSMYALSPSNVSLPLSLSLSPPPSLHLSLSLSPLITSSRHVLNAKLSCPWWDASSSTFYAQAPLLFPSCCHSSSLLTHLVPRFLASSPTSLSPHPLPGACPSFCPLLLLSLLFLPIFLCSSTSSPAFLSQIWQWTSESCALNAQVRWKQLTN